MPRTRCSRASSSTSGSAPRFGASRISVLLGRRRLSRDGLRSRGFRSRSSFRGRSSFRNHGFGGRSGFGCGGRLGDGDVSGGTRRLRAALGRGLLSRGLLGRGLLSRRGFLGGSVLGGSVLGGGRPGRPAAARPAVPGFLCFLGGQAFLGSGGEGLL